MLFVCGRNSVRSAMAEGFLRALGGKGVAVYSAGVTRGELRPETVEVMREVGIDILGHTSKTLADLGSATFDMVITLCDSAREYCIDPDPGGSGSFEKAPLFVGAPTHLHWPIPEPELREGGREEILTTLRKTRDQVADHVKTLLDQGYLTALALQHRHLEQLLDSMDDGIIVHDENRVIYLFNRAAERITGYRREEVLGKNCHRVFHPDGLCGSQCQFDRGKLEPSQRQQYEVVFTTKAGEDRRLRLVTAPTEIDRGGPIGIIATIRDITEVSELRWKMKEKYSFHGMVGVSPAMQEIFHIIRQVTTSDYPILITGESGTGKELVARAIHNESRRKGGPFVPINCGALPENILESELFGHVRGAFTGAIRDKKGRFELADKGTLFLDEVGELSPGFQVKLLRVLEEKRFEMVGGERTISVDVRVISATNRDLRKLVQEGNFRDDLFYRLSVVPMHLSPLRERKEDLPLLIEQVLQSIRQDTGKPIRSVSHETMDLLMAFPWPGNIRELINTLQFASVRCLGEEILPLHLPPELRQETAPAMQLAAGPLSAPPSISRRRRRLDSQSVNQALKETSGNKLKAAKLLGVGRATLYRFLEKHPGL